MQASTDMYPDTHASKHRRVPRYTCKQAQTCTPIHITKKRIAPIIHHRHAFVLYLHMHNHSNHSHTISMNCQPMNFLRPQHKPELHFFTDIRLRYNAF